MVGSGCTLVIPKLPRVFDDVVGVGAPVRGVTVAGVVIVTLFTVVVLLRPVPGVVCALLRLFCWLVFAVLAYKPVFRCGGALK